MCVTHNQYLSDLHNNSSVLKRGAIILSVVIYVIILLIYSLKVREVLMWVNNPMSRMMSPITSELKLKMNFLHLHHCRIETQLISLTLKRKKKKYFPPITAGQF